MSETGPQIHVGGDVLGQFVVGDHNVTVWAQQSVVTVLSGDRPRPQRRTTVGLPPRAGAEPIGRDQDMARLLDAVAATRLVQVYGHPGTGKTTLLRHAAAQPGDDTVFLSVAGRDVTDVLQDVFESCYDTHGYRPGPVELRRFMTGLPLRLFLDDLDAPEDQRAVLLDGVPDATVVFTSATRTLWTDGYAHELRGLTEESGLALVTRLLDRPLAADERAVASELWRVSAGSPLLLVRAVAGGRRAADGTATLPHAAELAELLPRIYARLSPQAREAVAILALAGGSAVAGELLPWLIADAATAPAALAELTDLGVALTTGPAFHLAPAITLPTELLIHQPHLAWVVSRLHQWARLPGQSPQAVADHVGLITNAIDACVAYGRPDIGGALAKVTAPLAACSLRLGAWEKILRHGIGAAQRAGDRRTVAYLTHEDGVHKLLTGKRVAAVAAIGAAITMWQELGDTAHIALAQHIQGVAAPATNVLPAAQTAPVHAVPQTAAQQAATHQTAAQQAAVHQAATATKATAISGKAGAIGTKTGLTAKAGIGVGAKLAIAGAATVVVAGTTAGVVLATHRSTPNPIIAVTRPAPQLTGVQLASVLVPYDQLGSGGAWTPGDHMDSGSKLLTAPSKYDWSSLSCADVSKLLTNTPANQNPGDPLGGGEVGESAYALGIASISQDGTEIAEAIIQFPTSAAASAYFNAADRLLTGCPASDTGLPAGSKVTAGQTDGHPSLSESDRPTGVTSYNYGNFTLVNNDICVVGYDYGGGDPGTDYEGLAIQYTGPVMAKLIANVDDVAAHPEKYSGSAQPSATR